MFRRRSHETSETSETPSQDATKRESAPTPAPAAAPTKDGARKDAKEAFTIIYRGTTVQGDIHAEGRVRVYGTVRGNLRVDGTLEVAESGYVEGDTVEVRVIKVIGRVHANIVADGKVEIWKGGVLEGDVKAAALDIEEGASFTGRSEMRGTAAAPHEGAPPADARSEASAPPAGDPAGDPDDTEADEERGVERGDEDAPAERRGARTRGGADAGASLIAPASDEGDFGEAFRESASGRK